MVDFDWNAIGTDVLMQPNSAASQVVNLKANTTLTKKLPMLAVDFQTDRARLFSRAPTKIFMGHIASASTLIYLAWDVLELHWLVAWGGWEILVTPVLLYKLGKQVDDLVANPNDLQKWQLRLYGLFFSIGLSWGTFVFFSLDTENPAHFSIQMAIVAGASAAASRSLSIFKLSFYLYEVPFAGLLATRVFMLGGDFMLLSVLVIIFIVMMCGLAHDTSEELSEYLATKLENLDLAKRFEAIAHEAHRANVSKTQFLAQANHDLRQPIHAIGLLVECLRDQKLDKEGYEILETINGSIDNLAKLFKTLLNIATIDAGGLTPELTSFPLNEVLAQTTRQALLSTNGNRCNLKYVKTSTWVNTDKALLASIVQNLVFNAVKHAPGAKILLCARVRGNDVEIHILDQGQGVPDDQQENIFREFFRGKSENTEGFGLGLSIVKRTANLLDLNVKFLSTFGKGTHVTVGGIMRAVPCNQKAKIEHVGSDGATNDVAVLVIDDDEEVRRSVEKLLVKWGYKATVQAPSTQLPEKFDVLLMDFQLGIEQDGIEFAKSISRQHDKFIPTAIVSGFLTSENEASALEAGFWILQKPVTPLQLRSVLLALGASQKENCKRTEEPG
ncbi:hybrid sensor histidine kinase/response regulator [Pseudovibrio sp. Tun.PSC04-5.I4]|uniref:ATP-binding response regulator n=1 Tax=Pseudovibrio sp. Tun.PSC04-5.I4 TaxID=1798213 RepID=UPI00088D21A6|nr:hybrid sensor histidine kinase/response regulator [Pseudovibrio sp. Tun.PSC04-5.I4]SDQ13392.1 Signal transduction histidine kinase [Pseudovibrio sp. Tun.PSC04-5.I4]